MFEMLWNNLSGILATLVVLGFAPNYIRRSKGHKSNVILWYVYGVFLFPVALVHAVMQGIDHVPTRNCPHCAKTVAMHAKVCPACAKELPPFKVPGLARPNWREKVR